MVDGQGQQQYLLHHRGHNRLQDRYRLGSVTWAPYKMVETSDITLHAKAIWLAKAISSSGSNRYLY